MQVIAETPIMVNEAKLRRASRCTERNICRNSPHRNYPSLTVQANIRFGGGEYPRVGGGEYPRFGGGQYPD